MAIDRLPPVGREEDLGELLRRLRPRLESILWRFRIAPEAAEDRVQNVMVGFVTKLSQIHTPEAWICKSLELECLMYLRSRRRDRTTPMEDRLIELIGPVSEPDGDRAVLRRQLARWIRKLSWKCRRLLRLRYGLELDAREVAERTGYKQSSVDKVTRRCVESLRRLLATAATAKARAKPMTRATSTARAKAKAGSKANPEPQAEPRPEPLPRPESKPKAGPRANALPEPRGKAKPGLKPKPAPKAKVRPKARAEPRPEPKAQPAPKPKPTPRRGAP